MGRQRQECTRPHTTAHDRTPVRVRTARYQAGPELDPDPTSPRSVRTAAAHVPAARAAGAGPVAPHLTPEGRRVFRAAGAAESHRRVGTRLLGPRLPHSRVPSASTSPFAARRASRAMSGAAVGSPGRTEIIVCTGLRTRGGTQLWGRSRPSMFCDRRQRCWPQSKPWCPPYRSSHPMDYHVLRPSPTLGTSSKCRRSPPHARRSRPPYIMRP